MNFSTVLDIIEAGIEGNKEVCRAYAILLAANLRGQGHEKQALRIERILDGHHGIRIDFAEKRKTVIYAYESDEYGVLCIECARKNLFANDEEAMAAVENGTDLSFVDKFGNSFGLIHEFNSADYIAENELTELRCELCRESIL